MSSELASSCRPKKCRLRFTYNDDLVLLREFVRENPFLFPGDEGWELLRRNVEIVTGKAFTLRTLKQHLLLLIELWLKKDQIDNVRSGLEGMDSEKDTLLQEVSTICREFNFTGVEKKKRVSKDGQLLEMGKRARTEYASKLVNVGEEKENYCPELEEEVHEELITEYVIDDHEYEIMDVTNEATDKQEIDKLLHVETITHDVLKVEPGPSSQTSDRSYPNVVPHGAEKNPVLGLDKTPTQKKRTTKGVLAPSRQRKREPLRKNALSYLTEKANRDYEIRIKELELEERKVAIEERRISIAEEKLELEKQQTAIELEERKVILRDREATSNIIQGQQKIIQTLLKEK